MLILTRRPGESIIVTDTRTGDRITFTVIQAKGNNIRVGTRAPEYYTIHREEVQSLIDQEMTHEDKTL